MNDECKMLMGERGKKSKAKQKMSTLQALLNHTEGDWGSIPEQFRYCALIRSKI
jgi:hypothetical protein